MILNMAETQAFIDKHCPMVISMAPRGHRFRHTIVCLSPTHAWWCVLFGVLIRLEHCLNAHPSQNCTFSRCRRSQGLSDANVQVSKAFQCIKPFAYKADIFRVCALWATGGVYADDVTMINRMIGSRTRCGDGTLLHVIHLLSSSLFQRHVRAASYFKT